VTFVLMVVRILAGALLARESNGNFDVLRAEKLLGVFKCALKTVH